MTENNESADVSKARLSRCAVLCLAIGVLGIFAECFRVIAFFEPPWLGASIRIAWGVVSLGAFACGVIGLRRCMLSPDKVKGAALAIIGIVLTLALVEMCLLYRGKPRGKPAVPCLSARNLQGLGRGLQTYAEEHGRYPDPNQWCDVMHDPRFCPMWIFSSAPVRGYVRWPFGRHHWFTLPPATKENCRFAMNPDCGPNSTYETILLFESKPGWNRHGGRELFEPRHKVTKGIGGYVCCKNGDLKFVTADTVAQLTWE